LETDKLAIFGSDPKTFYDPAANADELWEMGLNSMLKTTLGWGLEHEGDMDEIIKRGKWRLDGLLNFVRYFVEERGVSEGLFEGKLGLLMENLVPTLQLEASTEPAHSPTMGFDDDIIDVDAFEYEDAAVHIHLPSTTLLSSHGTTL